MKIKKTYASILGWEDITIALMNACKFTEIDRVITGGTQSSEMCVITFEGEESDFDDSFYVEKPAHGEYKYYYSLRVLSGCHTKEYEAFVEKHNQMKQSLTIYHI